MFYYQGVDTFAKLATVSADMHLEANGENECHPVISGRQQSQIPITEVAMPGGKKMKVLKTMLTSACERNCNYCPFRAGRKMRRQTFKPEEMARTYLAIYEAGEVEGIFLSSGIIKGGVTTQDRLIDTADILRNRLGYRGYMHLKLMPGVERDQVRRSMELANRVSANLEVPNPWRMHALAPMKDFTRELLDPLKWAQVIRKREEPSNTWNGSWASTITQFVVGPSGESDLELLSTSEFLYMQLGLKRTYFSAFTPIPDTPLDSLEPEDPIREHRLYQASFLVRDYGFSVEEMPFNQAGRLPLNKDPKTAWAEQNLLHNPVEVNTASREQLLTVPGIGVQGATKILRARRIHRIRSAGELKRMGIITTRLKPYLVFDGRQGDFQIGLFDLPAPVSRRGVKAFPG